MDRNIVKQKALARKRQRIRKKVAGSAERPRLSVYRSEKHIYGQLIDDEAGKTCWSSAHRSKDLRDSVKDLGPTEAATKVGEALAEKASAAGIASCLRPWWSSLYAGRVAALAEGARSKGLQF